ncbi:hypothetical protein QWI17_08540 [Gilvimarinus sp. SDUM040013]|uniref:Tetratricopeptide repeat protein n=1 Tax=Gilvimarinus gilvus TaxID=3058038 RepID=A0ABU4S5L1_9GAMM|nr:hypothetical protein [Gilvimarinus sp. SDUM040013]MDO3385883.1 hypothetical protein [Gilvimarinus sp. SDUM040013]MDX6850614.1 hypothetical protein [Gilvimarinus sp. SDUM040013]
MHRQAIGLIENGDWEGAHNLVQDESDTLSCLLHAYLHRDEGDIGNAGYWYRRAGESFPDNSLSEELERLKSML